jgi:ATP-dependent Lon protease
VLKEKTASSENAQTLKRLALLEKKEQTKLTRSVMEILRPHALGEIIGQERGVTALVSKLASPFPQHILIYGPPGVGKTSAARLALEEAKKYSATPFRQDAPFIEANGATLRWDNREVTNPLLGSVHDPIYQGAKREFAETGIPEPKLGLVSDANGGVLFIDEIGEMDPILLNKLMKVLEDKRVEFESSYYDPHDENVPQYIKKLFDHGAPADFVLIGATTRDPEELNPALRSRCAEVFFEPLTPVDIQRIVRNASSKLEVEMYPRVPEIISDYVVEGRKANNVLSDAYSLSLYKAGGNRRNLTITVEDVYEVVQSSRLVPNVTYKVKDDYEIGHTFGLGVSGFMGSVIEIEAVAFPSKKQNEGQLRFNDTAGSMAKDSFFNAAAVIRKITGEELSSYDVHVNVVGGARIDGPSAGCAIMLAMISAITQNPLRQSVAMTGEISIQGKIRPVGGITEKIYGAKLSGMKTVLIPEENKTDIPAGLKGIEVIPVSTVQDVIAHVARLAMQFKNGTEES